jgi:hypothetical protein
VTVSTAVKVEAAGVAVMVEVSKMVERTGVAVAVTVAVSGVTVTSCWRGEVRTQRSRERRMRTNRRDVNSRGERSRDTTVDVLVVVIRSAANERSEVSQHK